MLLLILNFRDFIRTRSIHKIRGFDALNFFDVLVNSAEIQLGITVILLGSTPICLISSFLSRQISP